MKKRSKSSQITIREGSQCKRLRFIFPIEAKAKQSVRKGTSKLGKTIFYKDSKVQDYEDLIKIYTNKQMKGRKLVGPILYSADYIFKAPKSYPKWVHQAIEAGKRVLKITKPDITDNLNKGIVDAMSNIVLETGDESISYGSMKKYYGPKEMIICEYIELPNPM